MGRFAAGIAALIASLVVVASPAARTDSARLRVVATDPVKVVGTGFHASERVRVVARYSGHTAAVRLRATRAGRFTAVIANATLYDPCNDTLRVTAAGSMGTRAEVKLPQRQCPPAP